jgi:hypothetical protein
MHGPPHHTGPPTPGYEGVPGGIPNHMIPFAPFSPGLTMSPGAFWGRPGPGHNPYAAVGAPVHLQHTPYGIHPVAGSPVGIREDPGGYFPPVPPQDYFPFVQPSSSRLANEIMPDGGSHGTNSKDTTPGSDVEQGGNPEEDVDAEIVSGAMDKLKLNGNGAHPRVLGSTTVEFDGRGHTHRSAHEANGALHRSGSDPVQTLMEKSSYGQTPPLQIGGQPRRASFAKVVSEGASPVQREAIAIDLGLRLS